MVLAVGRNIAKPTVWLLITTKHQLTLSSTIPLVLLHTLYLLPLILKFALSFSIGFLLTYLLPPMYKPCRAARLILPFFALLLQTVHGLAGRYGDCPTPSCKKDYCILATVHDAPGIGIDLTTSYGYAPIHFHFATTY